MTEPKDTIQIDATGDTVRYVDSHGTPMAGRTRPPRGSVGFWVGDGEIISLNSSHVQVIIDSPELFAMTREYVRSVYERYGEPLGHEGGARAELIKEAAREGWIRVRHYVGKGRDYWSIQADRIAPRRRNINLFLVFALEQGFAGRHEAAIILGYDDEQIERYPFTSGGIGGYADAFLK